METKSASRSRTPILIWLIASQLLVLISFFATAVGAYATLWSIAFAGAAWVAYARKKDNLAAILTTLTILPVLVLILIIVLVSFFFPYGF